MGKMKTTVEIADGLLADAKLLAREQKITLRELIEDGLRFKLAQERAPRPAFQLKDASFKGGHGMGKDFSWDEIMEITYEGRGGMPSRK